MFPGFTFQAPALQAAVRWRTDNWNRILLLLENGPAHQQGHYGNPLRFASLLRASDAVRALLDGGADPNLEAGGIFNTASTPSRSLQWPRGRLGPASTWLR
ncbi:hypothetical protein E5D57_013036 [Metarhizium anisopliae]|nr:hypothetical protein E5D57_013036 [Metarhizium anisopliae]